MFSYNTNTYTNITTFMLLLGPIDFTCKEQLNVSRLKKVQIPILQLSSIQSVWTSFSVINTFLQNRSSCFTAIDNEWQVTIIIIFYNCNFYNGLRFKLKNLFLIRSIYKQSIFHFINFDKSVSIEPSLIFVFIF